MVSESMRDLFKHQQFKTNQVILPSLQLVQSVKDLKFDSAMVDTTRVHNIIDQLESAVLNTIINSHVIQPSPARYFTLGRRPKPSRKRHNHAQIWSFNHGIKYRVLKTSVDLRVDLLIEWGRLVDAELV
ncbi:hypothetical protein OESDEN_09508 [Oesophagostomum dentatum]|uniref:Uncharacterized protein n=1 Tax=Oesophagostomum dentatum TaxID=61180 RepID=A0A0B1T5M1_OESDE|nr:hypothetical protein OESDEN_09508 [Oesophagostomum dentatum]